MKTALAFLLIATTICFAQSKTEIDKQSPPQVTPKAGCTIYMSDGNFKARRESESKNGKNFTTKILDSADRLEFIEYTVYDANSGTITEMKRVLPNGTPWPYPYPIYGTASLGGLEKLKNNIKAIGEITSQIDTQFPILEISFLSDSRVEVMTGIIRGPLDGSGQFHRLKKKDNSWKKEDKDGSVHMWVS